MNQSYATNIKETGQTFIPMLAAFVAVGTNATSDYLMIFGIGPFPEPGVQGAALATVIARYIEALIVVIWAHIHRGKKPLSGGELYTGFGIPLAELKAILIKGFPLMMNEVLWAAGMTTVTQLFCQRSGRGGGTEHCLHHHESVQYCLSSVKVPVSVLWWDSISRR